jgi:hypothetical protein
VIPENLSLQTLKQSKLHMRGGTKVMPPVSFPENITATTITFT